MKKTFAFLTLFIILCFFTKIDVKATESGKCGENATWEIVNSNTLVISGTGETYDYSNRLLVPWKDNYSQLTNVIVKDGITKLGKSIFSIQGCYGSTVFFDTQDTSFDENYKYKYGKNINIKNVTLPNSLKEIEDDAFYLTAIETINIPDSVEKVSDSAFSACFNISNITISKNEFNKLNFQNHIKFTLWGINNGYSYGKFGDNITYKFTKDNTLTISGSGNINKSINFWYPWFSYRFRLEKVKINEGISNLPYHMFDNCHKLEKIELPNSLKIFDYGVFFHCENLTSITIPQNIKVISADMFSGCEKLKSVIIKGNITRIEQNAFYNCTSLKELDLGNSNPMIGNNAFGNVGIKIYHNIKNGSFENYGGMITWISKSTQKISMISKSTQKISIAKIKTYKVKNLKKKKISFSLKAKSSGNGKLSYKVTKGKSKYITVSKSGKVTLKKKCKKGTYKIAITANETSAYKKVTKVVTIKVK